MRKVLVSIAALGVALTAAPAMAQSYGYPGGGYGQGYGGNRYMVPSPSQVRDMVERAIQNREVSWRDARRLRDAVRDLYRVAQRNGGYGNGDYGDRRELQRRTFQVLRDLREARDDDGRRGGYGNGYGDRDNDGYRDRDDRYDNDPYRR